MVEVFRSDLWGLRNGARWIFSSENPSAHVGLISTTFTPPNQPCTPTFPNPTFPSTTNTNTTTALLLFSSPLVCKDLVCTNFAQVGRALEIGSRGWVPMLTGLPHGPEIDPWCRNRLCFTETTKRRRGTFENDEFIKKTWVSLSLAELGSSCGCTAVPL